MINKLHERALRLLPNVNVNDFEALLCKSNVISCHHRKIQMLMIDLYKIVNEVAPPVVDSVLNRRDSLAISEYCKSFSQKERELFLMA